MEEKYTVDLIFKYFDQLTDKQTDQLTKLYDVYKEWNDQINVISRKDFDSLYLKHVLHSLSIAAVADFVPGTSVLDVGTGGGFPGVPLAIMFPEVKFQCIDSIGKKIKVVKGVKEALGLDNIVATQIRSTELKGKYDFIVSRAVTAFPSFVSQVRHLISKKDKNAFPNGIIYLKGGDFEEEIKPFGKSVDLWDINQFFEEEFFETKKIIYLSL